MLFTALSTSGRGCTRLAASNTRAPHSNQYAVQDHHNHDHTWEPWSLNYNCVPQIPFKVHTATAQCMYRQLHATSEVAEFTHSSHESQSRSFFPYHPFFLVTISFWAVKSIWHTQQVLYTSSQTLAEHTYVLHAKTICMEKALHGCCYTYSILRP